MESKKFYSNKNINEFKRTSTSSSSENFDDSKDTIVLNNKNRISDSTSDAIKQEKRPRRSRSTKMNNDELKCSNVKRSKSFDENCIIISKNPIFEDESGEHLKNIIERHVKTLNKLINHITVIKNEKEIEVDENEEELKLKNEEKSFEPADILLSSIKNSNKGEEIEIKIEKEKSPKTNKNENEELVKRLDRVEKMIQELANKTIKESKKDKKKKNCLIS
jgi:hypothetical protein